MILWKWDPVEARWKFVQEALPIDSLEDILSRHRRRSPYGTVFTWTSDKAPKWIPRKK